MIPSVLHAASARDFLNAGALEAVTRGHLGWGSVESSRLRLKVKFFLGAKPGLFGSKTRVRNLQRAKRRLEFGPGGLGGAKAAKFGCLAGSSG